jgi:hypothetical protein
MHEPLPPKRLSQPETVDEFGFSAFCLLPSAFCLVPFAFCLLP